jgi:hypothetical protein
MFVVLPSQVTKCSPDRGGSSVTAFAGSVLMMVLVAVSPPPSGNSLAALREQFGPAIEYEAAPAPRVRYCPDNTCQAFDGKRGAKATDVTDFALLYLWGVSRYAYLDSWQKGAPPAALVSVLARHGSSCPSQTGRLQLACTLRALGQAARITVSEVTYDEGAQTDVKVNIEEQLRRMK